MIIIASLQHTFLLNTKFYINFNRIILSAILLANIDASKYQVHLLFVQQSEKENCIRKLFFICAQYNQLKHKGTMCYFNS